MAGASSSAGARKARRQRSNTKAMFRMRCTQRQAPGIDRFAPVRLVVFDFDECLTLLTYDVRETDPPATQEKYIRLNFESPWVDGSRLAYLRRMLKDIATSVDGQPRCIAVLTRNNMGVRAVLTILKLAGLADHFSAVWSIPYRAGNRHGAYRDRRGSWLMFDPPILDVPDHKADVLQHMADHPVQWFPQAANGRRPPRLRELFGSGVGSTLKLEEFVLVDDQRANFQSASGAQVLRYGKVARYDAPYSNMGVCKNMGGIGAHSELDYRTLKRFVEEPWLYSETLQVACYEQGIEDNERVPVEIVVFDFDETLTIATFMPQERGFREEVGWCPSRRRDSGMSIDSRSFARDSSVRRRGPVSVLALTRFARRLGGSAPIPGIRAEFRQFLSMQFLVLRPSSSSDWTRSSLVEYNFESPWVSGRRAVKLQRLLQDLAQDRTVAILTRNAAGVIAVLNLLSMAGLEKSVSAIWGMQPWVRGARAVQRGPGGMYQHHDGYWQPFDPPFHEVSDHKADVLHHVAQHRAAWLPQLAARAGGAAAVGPLRPEAVLLVDDERANFRHYKGDGAVTEALRCCKVPRYDDLYRDCGPLNQLGGLGAHSDADYDSVRRFVEEPWEFPSLDTQLSFVAADLSDNHVVAVESEELALLPRERGPKTLFGRRAPVRRPTRGSSGLLGPAACSLAGCLRWARGVCAAGCGALAP